MYARVSYSSLERFETCSTRQLLHSQRKRSPLGVGYVLVGNALHSGLATWIDTGGQVSVLEAALWEFERRLREEKPPWTRQEVMEHLDKVKRGALATSILVTGMWKNSVLRSEVRLFKAFRGWSIEGYLDLMVGYGEEVWDLKSGRWHHDQLVFYDVLVEEVLGKRPNIMGIIEPLGRGLIDFPVTDEHRYEMRSRIRAFVERVSADDWKFEGYQEKCSWCLSKPFCSRWAAARSGSLVGA